MAQPTTLIPADEGLFITIGVPRGPRARKHADRAVSLLKRNGYRAAVTSDDAIKAAAEILDLAAQDDERTDPQ